MKNYKQMALYVSPRNSNQTCISIMIMIMIMMMKYLCRIIFMAPALRIISVPSCIYFFQSSNSLKQKFIIHMNSQYKESINTLFQSIMRHEP